MRHGARISGGERIALLCRRSLLVALSLIAVAAAPGLVAAQESERHDGSSVNHEAAKEHGESDHHKNHVAFFVGSTEAEEHHGEKGDRDFTIGIDYERRLSKVFGIGAFADWVIEGDREYIVGIPLFLHAGKHAIFQLAPAYHRLSHSGEEGFLFRTGFMWDFNVGKISLLPAIYYDFTEGQDFLVFGLNVGKGF